MKNDIASVSPALEKYSKTALAELWSRPGLSHRDRSLATVAALIAAIARLSCHTRWSLRSQLAFYAGWRNVFSALPVANDVFDKRRR